MTDKTFKDILIDVKMSPLGSSMGTPDTKDYFYTGNFLYHNLDNRVISIRGETKVLILGERTTEDDLWNITIPSDLSNRIQRVFKNHNDIYKLIKNQETDSDGAFELFKIAELCYRAAGTDGAIVELSNMYTRIGDYLGAHGVLVKYKRNTIKKANKTKHAQFYVELGKSYMRLDDLGSAASIFTELSNEKEVDNYNRAECFKELALSCIKKNYITEALEYLNSAMNIADDSDKHRYSYISGLVRKNKLSRNYLWQKRVDSLLGALEDFKATLDYSQLINNNAELQNLVMGKCYRSIAKCLAELFRQMKAPDLSKTNERMDTATTRKISEFIHSFLKHEAERHANGSGEHFANTLNTIIGIHGANHNLPGLFCMESAEYAFEKAPELLKDYPIIASTAEKESYDFHNFITSLSRSNSKNPLNHLFLKTMESLEMKEMEATLSDNKEEWKQFLREKYRTPDKPKPPTFHVLQRWNSFTPIIPDDTIANRGGGYFINTSTQGLAIDPGFDFIKNLAECDLFSFSDIDHIFITHAHNDHTADLESILTLLKQYNDRIKGDEYSNEFSQSVFSLEIEHSKGLSVEQFERVIEKRWRQKQNHRRKTITIYMTASTFKKYSPLLKLHSEESYSVKIVDRNTSAIAIGDEEHEDLWVFPIFAKHDDVLSNQDSVGFVFSTKDCCLIYTGDTGFDKTLEKEYADIANALKNNSKCVDSRYKKLCSKPRTHVLLAHIGGFKQYENTEYFREPIYRNYYKNHLGRLGLINLIFTLKPKYCLVSEFGEEFISPLDPNDHTKRLPDKSPRIKLCELLNREIPKTKFFPADIGFTLTLEENCHVKIGSNSYAPEEITLFEKDDGTLKYKKLKRNG
jgi:ribonuclease BN (tRNA processing enzyme)/tetratricopeptide (TPR) repeat protein